MGCLSSGHIDQEGVWLFFFFFHKFSIALHCALGSLFCVEESVPIIVFIFCLSDYYFLYFTYTCNSTFNHHYVFFVNIS